MSGWKLVADRPDYPELPLSLGQPVTVGRKSAHVVVPHQRVSSTHMTLTLVSSRPPRLHVRDDSTNGVFVGGERVPHTSSGSRETHLSPGDIICINYPNREKVSEVLGDHIPCFTFMSTALQSSPVTEDFAATSLDSRCDASAGHQATFGLPKPAGDDVEVLEASTPELSMPDVKQPLEPLYGRAPGKPSCRFGKDCYRTQPAHYAEFDHPAEHPKINAAGRATVDLTGVSGSSAIELLDKDKSPFAEFRHKQAESLGTASGWRARPGHDNADSIVRGADRRGRLRVQQPRARGAARGTAKRATNRTKGRGTIESDSDDQEWEGAEDESEESEESEADEDASNSDASWASVKKRRQPSRATRAKAKPQKRRRRYSESDSESEEAISSDEEESHSDNGRQKNTKGASSGRAPAPKRGGARAAAPSREKLQKIASEENEPAEVDSKHANEVAKSAVRQRRVIISDDDDDGDNGLEKCAAIAATAKDNSANDDADEEEDEEGEESEEESVSDDDDDEAKAEARPLSDLQRSLSQALRDCEQINEQIKMRLRCNDVTAGQGCLSPTSFGGGSSTKVDREDVDAEAGGQSKSKDLLHQPATFGSEGRLLSGYQLVGLNWLWVMHELGLGGILADEMGLGKTVQIIALLAALKESGKAGPHLVVAPGSVLDNWYRELRTWCPSLHVVKYHGSRPARHRMQSELAASGFDVALTTYTYFEGEGEANIIDRKWLYGKTWGCCVLDEAHALKRADSARYMRLSKLRSAQRVLLTGTPVQNNTRELLTLLSFMLPKIFPPGLAAAFAAKPAGSDDAADVRRARRLLAPFVLRRSKRDVLQQLAPKSEEEAIIPMSHAQRKLYATLLERGRKLVVERQKRSRGRAPAPSLADTKAAKSLFSELRKAACHPCLLRSHYTSSQLDEIARAAHAMESFGRSATLKMIRKELETNSDFQLHQLCVELPQLRKMKLPHDVLCDSGKVARLIEMLPRLRAEGHKVLIFSQSTQMLDILESILGEPPGLDMPFVRLDGSTAVEERQELIDSFQAPDSPLVVFLLSTRAGGQGITLTAADTVIIHDLDWNPQLDRQAVDRAHRIGQTRPVQVLRMVTQETVEEQIHMMQQRKAGLDAELLGDARKTHRTRNAALSEGEGENVDLDVRMMTTMIHEALAAPFLIGAPDPPTTPRVPRTSGSEGRLAQEQAASKSPQSAFEEAESANAKVYGRGQRGSLKTESIDLT